MFKNTLFYIFVTLFLLVEIDARICKKKVVTTHLEMTQVTYSYLTRNKYSGRSRIEVKMKPRYIKRLHDVTFCCDGYSKYDDDVFEIIERPCISIYESKCKNGNCPESAVWACSEGYIKRNDTCIPCEEGCLHGTCVGARGGATCQCDTGYIFVNDKCEPLAPLQESDTTTPIGYTSSLQCLPGYKESENVCKPYCSSGCRNGFCVAPEMCFCDPGYRQVKNDGEAYICVPECKIPCGNGTCFYPDTCSCFTGYRIDNSRQFQTRSNPRPICVPNKPEDSNMKLSYNTKTSTKSPLERTSRYQSNTKSNNMTTTTSSYLINNNSSTGRVGAQQTDTVQHLVSSKNNTKVDVTLKIMQQDSIESSQTQQNEMSILISIIIGKFNTSCSSAGGKN